MARIGPRDLMEEEGGHITSSFFPQDNEDALDKRLQKYLDQGYKLADQSANEDKHAIAEAWAYYRAYSAVADRINLNPASVSLADQGSQAYSGDQIRDIQSKVTEWREAFRRLHSPETITTTRPRTGAVRNVIRW